MDTFGNVFNVFCDNINFQTIRTYFTSVAVFEVNMTV